MDGSITEERDLEGEGAIIHVISRMHTIPLDCEPVVYIIQHTEFKHIHYKYISVDMGI